MYGGALGLTSCCLYGNTPYAQQENKLRRGVDIVVGTPGRVKVPFFMNSTLDFAYLYVLEHCIVMLQYLWFRII